MNIALIGYGKMGRIIEQMALKQGHSITTIIDIDNGDEWDQMHPKKVDVAIEFTQPGSAFENINNCLLRGVKVISGTTGWLDRYDEIVKTCTEKNGTFLHASNFSLGVNIFFELNKWLGKFISDFQNYVPEIEEIHHTEKLDKPSGTAITLAEGLIETNSAIKRWELGNSTESNSVIISSKRIPNVPGTHTIKYESDVDSIEIKHTAFSRTGFADGVIKVAEWIQDKQGVFTINDFLKK